MKVNRREAIGIAVAGSSAVAAPLRAFAAPPTAGIEALRVCGLDNPLALGDLTPRFSWKLGGGARSPQVAYRLCVARSEVDLIGRRNLVWDSGRVVSASGVDQPYGGPKLPSRSKVWWQVETWTKDGKSLRSAPAMWETGLAPADWQGEWIASETLVAQADRTAGLHWITGPDRQNIGQTRAFRWTFDHPGGPAEFCATLHELSGVWINGEPAPEPRDGPARHTEMAVWRVNLQKGRNVIAIAGRRVGSFGVPTCVLAALLRHGPELRERMTSASPGWKTAIAPPQGWNAPGFDDAAWAAAVPVTGGSLPVGEPWPLTPASRLRHVFTVDRPIRAARLHATAAGIYQPWLNGAAIGDRKLAPEFTDPSKRLLYQTYDVTAHVKPGANVLGMVVGDGWYGSRFSTSARFAFGPAPCRMLCQLELEHDDGSRTVIGSGKDWQIADSGVMGHSIYDGEIFDARVERADWAMSGSAEQGWRAASVVPAPPAPVDPQRCPPIRVRETLQPKDVRRLGPGRYVLDFGQNFAGFERLTLAAPAGTRIEMHFAEVLKADGSVDQANLRSAKARDVYIAAGSGREVYEPRFTYHGYRYVEITGVPDDRSAWSLEGLVAHQDLPFTAELSVGDPVIEQFWRNSVWSQKSNFYGLPTDCPQRDERLGWMGDAEVFWPAAAWNMDVTAYTARVMEDVRSSQSAQGAFPDCIPPFVPTMKLSSPGWADAGVILPYTSWMQNGDTGVVRANWSAMETYMAWIEKANPDHVWRKQRGADYGDWLSVDAPTSNPGAPTTPKDLLATALWANDAAMMAQMAEALGNAAAAARYRDLFQTIRGAFNATFVSADGKVGNGSQTGLVVAIRFGLLSPEQTRAAGAALAADIARRGNHLSTGFIGTPHILDALAMSGQEAMAITLLTQRTFPSWGYMVDKGATTMWERWNSDQGDVGMNSRNHYAFGAIGDFLFRRIAGIAPATPGFGKVRIAPIMSPALGKGGATYQSVRGPIRTAWTAVGGQFRLDVDLPAGVDGEVILPGGRATRAVAGPNRFSGKL